MTKDKAMIKLLREEKKLLTSILWLVLSKNNNAVVLLNNQIKTLTESQHHIVDVIPEAGGTVLIVARVTADNDPRG